MAQILQAVLIVKQQTQINIKHLMCVNKKYGYIHFALHALELFLR
jgi:hypothetical protein